MLGLAAALGGGAFVLVSCVASVRLLALASRTRQLPELAIGGGLLLLAGIGYPALTAGQLLGEGSALRPLLLGGSGVVTLLGLSAVALFNWRVFRPDERWPALLTAALPAAMAGLWAWQALGPGWSSFGHGPRDPWALQQACSLVTMGWACVESVLYHAKLRRRLAMGLADALVTDRLRLFAIAMGASFVTTAIASVLRVRGVPMTGEVTGLFVGPLGLVSAAAMWLAFLPPNRYVNRVLARAGAGA